MSSNKRRLSRMLHPYSPSPVRRPTLTSLPREVIRLIAVHIYDPLELSQQDRLTWGIFSTVDMHAERQADLYSLIAFGHTCKVVRREVRVVLFRCIRTPTVGHVEQVIANRDDWGKYVRSLIIDLHMFDDDPPSSSPTRQPSTIPGPSAPLPHSQSPPGGTPLHVSSTSATGSGTAPKVQTPRSCWAESSLLVQLLKSLPSLEHVSFFADASDDGTLVLLFASLISHPSLFPIPPPTVPPSPSVTSTKSLDPRPTPLTSRLRSFGWRQRGAPPAGFRNFSQASIFVSTLHLLRHAHRLSFVVLDADLTEMTAADILVACQELALREKPPGEENEAISLMLCGPIRGWGHAFLQDLVGTFSGIKELFIDRPLRKSSYPHQITFDDLARLLEPLARLPHLRLLQVGSYALEMDLQERLVLHLAAAMPALLVVGLLQGDQGITVWWGIWRRANSRPDLPLAVRDEGVRGNDDDGGGDTIIMPLGEGHMRMLEDAEAPPEAQSDLPTLRPSWMTPIRLDSDVDMEAGAVVKSQGSLGVVLSGDGTKSASQLEPGAGQLDKPSVGVERPERGKRTMSLEEILQAGKA